MAIEPASVHRVFPSEERGTHTHRNRRWGTEETRSWTRTDLWIETETTLCRLVKGVSSRTEADVAAQRITEWLAELRG